MSVVLMPKPISSVLITTLMNKKNLALLQISISYSFLWLIRFYRVWKGLEIYLESADRLCDDS